MCVCTRCICHFGSISGTASIFRTNNSRLVDQGYGVYGDNMEYNASSQRTKRLIRSSYRPQMIQERAAVAILPEPPVYVHLPGINTNNRG